MPDKFTYSEKYQDEIYEYRHVSIEDRTIVRLVPKSRLLSEEEWRKLGITMSRGWVHFMHHRPDPHILLFRRPIGTDPITGLPPAPPPPLLPNPDLSTSASPPPPPAQEEEKKE
jgi:cyclin-dependent kinase regulatory subunit CKS1